MDEPDEQTVKALREAAQRLIDEGTDPELVMAALAEVLRELALKPRK